MATLSYNGRLINITDQRISDLFTLSTGVEDNMVYALKDSENKLLFGIDEFGYAYFNKDEQEKQIIHVFTDTSSMQGTAYLFDYALVLNDVGEDKVMQLYIGSDTSTPDAIAMDNTHRYAIPVFKTILPVITREDNDNGVMVIADENGKIALAVDSEGELLFNKSPNEDDHVVKVYETLADAQTTAYLYQYAIITATDYTGGLYKVTDEVTSCQLLNGKYLKLIFGLNDYFSEDPSFDAVYSIKDKNGKVVFAIDEEGEPIITTEPTENKYVVRTFDTVADMQNSAYPFDYAITVGFHSANDGGGAMYKVVTGLTANGMDIISLGGTNRCAQLIHATTMYVEQYGMKKADENYSIAPIIERMVQTGVIDVRLHAGLYWAKRPTVVTAQHSLHISGHDCWKNYDPRYDDLTNPRQGSTCIYFRSTRTDTGAAVFAFEYRCVCIENMFLHNRPNPGDPGRIGILCYMDDESKPDWAPDVGHYGYIFKRLYIYGFNIGMQLMGKVVWDCQFDDVRVSACDVGLWLGSSGTMLCSFRLFYTDHCTTAGIRITTTTMCASFWSCNFGTYGKAVEWFKFTDEDFPGDRVSATFYDCNFETDQEKNNTDGFCVYTADWYQAILTFIGCEFSVRKMPNMPNSTALSFGTHTTALFENCRAFDTENEIAQEKFFDNRRCLAKSGAISFIGHNDLIPRPNWDDGMEGTVLEIGVDGAGVPQFKTLANASNIDMVVGQQFYVIDEDALYIKKQNGFTKIA